MRQIHIDEDNDNIKLIVTKDLEQELEDIKSQREANVNNGFSKKRTLRQLGHIPMDVLMSLGEEGLEIMRDPEKARQFFREHPEYRLCDKV